MNSSNDADGSLGSEQSAYCMLQSQDRKNTYYMSSVSNHRIDRTGRLVYTRSFLHNADYHIESTNESNDRFMRHLFHETKTPLQILLSIKPFAHFDADDDHSAFVTAIDSLSTLTLDMSILCGNTNNGQECLSKDGTLAYRN